MSTARADFFLSPSERLTEQERAAMTAMLSDLVSVVADEIDAAQGRAKVANDRETRLFERLFEAGLLDIPALISVLLRRAEEERLAATLRSAGRGRRLLHSLAGNEDADVAAAAMALILARSRRRDRFDQPRLDLDDVPAEAAVSLVYAVAAAMRAQRSSGDDTRILCSGAAAVLAGHDEGKRIEALGFALVHALDSVGQLDEELMLSAMNDGEVAILVEALARRAGVEFGIAWDHLSAGGDRLARLLRLAGVSRQLAAEMAACLGDDSGGGAAAVIGSFDSYSDEDIEQAREHWRVPPAFRSAMTALGGSDGHAAD